MLNALLSSSSMNLAGYYRDQIVNPLVFSLGCHLKRDIPLEEALFRTSKVSVKRDYQIRLQNAAAALKNGESIKVILTGRTLAFFPNKVRVILASELSNENKGRLLTDWERSGFDGFANVQQLTMIAATAGTGVVVIMGLVMFVIPQFREIAMGLNVKMPQIFSWLVYIGNNIPLVLFLMIAAPMLMIGIFGFMVKHFVKIGEQVDYANLFKLLAIIDRSDLKSFTPLISSKIMFPNKHASFKKFILAINNGVIIEEAAENANIDKFNLWFLKLGLVNQESGLILDSAAKMIDSKLKVSKKTIITFGTSLAIIVQGIGIGFIVYGVFSMMIHILVMSFQVP